MTSPNSTPPPPTTPSLTSSTSSTLLRTDLHHLLREALHLPRKHPVLADWLFTPPDQTPRPTSPILSPTIFNLSNALLAEAHHPNCTHNLPHNATLGSPIPLRHHATPHPNFCMNRHQLFVPALLHHHFILGYTLDSGAPHLFSISASSPSHPFPVLGKLVLDLSTGTLLTYSPSRQISRACFKFSKGLSTSARTCHSLLLPLLEYSGHHLPSDVLCVFTSVYEKRSSWTDCYPQKRQRQVDGTALRVLTTGVMPDDGFVEADAVLDDFIAPDFSRGKSRLHAAQLPQTAVERAWRKKKVDVLFDLRTMMRGGPATRGAAATATATATAATTTTAAAAAARNTASVRDECKGETPFDVELMKESLEDLEHALEGRFYCSRVRFAALDPITGRCVEKVSGGLGVVIVAAAGAKERDMRREAMMEYYAAVLAVETDGKLGGSKAEDDEDSGGVVRG